MFELITPISYWILIALWSVILVFYIRKRKVSKAAGGAVYLLLLILSVDAFRTIFESAYFGLYFNSLFGILPKYFHDVLSNPALIVLPKLVNIIAGGFVLFLLVRKWDPVEFRKREDWENELKKETQVAKEHRSNLNAILNSISDGIVFTDLDRQIVSVNKGMQKTFGYVLDDLKGMKTEILYEDQAEYEHQGQKRFNLTAEQKLEPYEVRYRRKNGEVFVGETLGVPVEDGDGNIKGFLGVIRDITERKRRETELEGHRDHLQELVIERTKELQLSSEKANEANQAKSLFLSSMSHELRTPLNAVLGFAQLLENNRNEVLSEKQRRYVNQIINGGEHLLVLINEVLDLAKVEAGKMTYSIEKIDTKSLIENCLISVEPIAFKNDVKVFDTTGDTLPPLMTDAFRYKQAVLNILSNAIKYNRKGGRVYIETETLNDGYQRIMIRDTGPGISEEKQKLLFQPFQRLGVETSDIEGTGIGLTLTKKFVEEMQGRIGLESQEGEGSTFWIDFPIAEESETRPQTLEVVEIHAPVSVHVVDQNDWTNNITMGFAPIDEDHKQLFNILDKVSESGLSVKQIEEVLEELVDYTKHHFVREEMLMESFDYPDINLHKSHHLGFIKKIERIQSTYKTSPNNQIQNVCRSVLREWLVNHIMSHDKMLSEYLLGKEDEVVKVLA